MVKAKFGRAPFHRGQGRKGIDSGNYGSGAPKLFTAEQSSLPQITLNNGSKGKSFTAYVTSYVVSKERQMLKGTGYHSKYLLWYLSMVAAPGNGTALQAIYSALVSTNNKEVHLEGIGDVAVGTKSDYLVGEGYSTHFNYDQQRVALPGGQKALHGILEPKVLTSVDPQKALAQARTRRGGGKGESDPEAGGGGQSKRESLSLSTASSGSGNADAWQQLAEQEQKPFFLLLVPGIRKGDEQYLAGLYRSFLDRRLPYPLKPEWALPLWQANNPGAWEVNYDVQTLKVWSYPDPWGKQVHGEQADTDQVPVNAEAYLCKPDAQKIATLMKELVLKDKTQEREQGVAA